MEFHSKLMGPELVPRAVEGPACLGPRDRKNHLLNVAAHKWHWGRVAEDGSTVRLRYVAVRALWSAEEDPRVALDAATYARPEARRVALDCAGTVFHALEALRLVGDQLVLPQHTGRRLRRADGCALARASCVTFVDAVPTFCLAATADQSGRLHAAAQGPLELTVAQVMHELVHVADLLGLDLAAELKKRAALIVDKFVHDDDDESSTASRAALKKPHQGSDDDKDDADGPLFLASAVAETNWWDDPGKLFKGGALPDVVAGSAATLDKDDDATLVVEGDVRGSLGPLDDDASASCGSCWAPAPAPLGASPAPAPAPADAGHEDNRLTLEACGGARTFRDFAMLEDADAALDSFVLEDDLGRPVFRVDDLTLDRTRQTLDDGLAWLLVLFHVLRRGPFREMTNVIRASERLLKTLDAPMNPHVFFDGDFPEDDEVVVPDEPPPDPPPTAEAKGDSPKRASRPRSAGPRSEAKLVDGKPAPPRKNRSASRERKQPHRK